MFRRGIPLNVFLSSAVGNADGFCRSEPVPMLLSFDGLITDAVGVELVSPAEPLLPPVALEVDDVVEVEVAVPDEAGDAEAAPEVNVDGNFIDDDRLLEPPTL